MQMVPGMNSFLNINFLSGLITVIEAARISGFSRQYLRRLLRNGSLNGEKIGQM